MWAITRHRKRERKRAEALLVDWIQTVIPITELQTVPMDAWVQQARTQCSDGAGCKHLEHVSPIVEHKDWLENALLAARHLQMPCCARLARRLLVVAAAGIQSDLPG